MVLRNTQACSLIFLEMKIPKVVISGLLFIYLYAYPLFRICMKKSIHRIVNYDKVRSPKLILMPIFIGGLISVGRLLPCPPPLLIYFSSQCRIIRRYIIIITLIKNFSQHPVWNRCLGRLCRALWHALLCSIPNPRPVCPPRL